MDDAYEFCRDPSYLPIVAALIIGLIISVCANIILLAQRS